MQRVWEISTEGASRSGLVAVPGGVLLGNEAGVLTRVDEDGHVRWSHRLQREIAARPAVARGVAVAASMGGEWIGVGVEQGDVRWRLAGQPPVRARLVSDGEQVFALGADGALQAMDAETGAVRWRRPLPPLAPGMAQPTGGPAVLGPLVVVALRDGALMALRTADGEPAWRAPLGGQALTLGAGESVYAALSNAVVAVGADGKTRWTSPLEVAPSGRMTVIGGEVVLPVEQRVVAIAEESGRVAWSVPISGRVTAVTRVREVWLAATDAPAGWLYAIAPGADRAFASVRLDTPLRTAPVPVDAERALVAGADGRVVMVRVRPPPRPTAG